MQHTNDGEVSSSPEEDPLEEPSWWEPKGSYKETWVGLLKSLSQKDGWDVINNLRESEGLPSYLELDTSTPWYQDYPAAPPIPMPKMKPEEEQRAKEAEEKYLAFARKAGMYVLPPTNTVYRMLMARSKQIYSDQKD